MATRRSRDGSWLVGVARVARSCRTAGGGILLALWLVAAGTARAQNAELVSDAELLATPAAGAEKLARVKKKSAVTVLERKGGWYRVSAEGQEGWVKLLAVRLTARPDAPQEGSGDPDAGTAIGAAAGASTVGGAATSALGSMMTGQSADSTAVRGGSSGTLTGKRLVGATEAGAETPTGTPLEQVNTYQPSDEDLDAFERGGEATGQQP